MSRRRKRRRKRRKVGWMLFAYPDEDAPVLEVFSPPDHDRKPTQRYIETMYGDGYLYEYDISHGESGEVWINGRPAAPEGFEI